MGLKICQTPTTAKVHSKVKSVGRLGWAIGVDAIDKVALEIRALAEAKIHVLLGTIQRRMLSHDILEACNLKKKKKPHVSVQPCFWTVLWQNIRRRRTGPR